MRCPLVKKEVKSMHHSHNQVEDKGKSTKKRSLKFWTIIGLAIFVSFIMLFLNQYPAFAPEDESEFQRQFTEYSVENTKNANAYTPSYSPKPSFPNKAESKRKNSIEFSDLIVMINNKSDIEGIGHKVLEKTEELRYENSIISTKVMESNMVLIPREVAPGDVVLVRNQQPISIEWQDRKYVLQKFGLGYYAYLPIPINLEPGIYKIGEIELTIVPKKFETQYVQVSEQMESMQQNTERIEADQKKINNARSVSTPTFLFLDTFISPLEGTLTTPYGYMRYVNGKLSSRHRALDIAAPEGTPILATNDGIVVLADNLYLTGNSIYIDHGMNLFSQYAHMSKLLVKTGDIVKRGEVIGLVGTTGFSTGPHLHFTFWANSVPVNPDFFIGKTPFQWIETDDVP